MRLVDVIVLLPGITGSVLRYKGKDVWALSGKGFLNALLSGGGDIQRLRLTADPPDQLELDDGVTVGGLMPTAHLMPGLWKIDGYSETGDALRTIFQGVQPGRNYFEFAYDWRRDNRVTARILQRQTREWLSRWRSAPDGNPGGKLILVAHSMGGLVSRYFLEVLDGWVDTRALVTFGTPYSGSLNALDFLANGYRKAFGLVDMTELIRSFTSIYQLLPTYKCCDFGDGALARVDDPRGIPGLEREKVLNALAFHNEIAAKVSEHTSLPEYVKNRYGIYPIIGTHQPTLESARIRRGTAADVELLADYRGEDYEGDGTVPRVSATPLEWADPGLGMFAAQRHASLQCTQAVLEHLEGVLTSLYMRGAVERAVRPRAELAAPPVRLALALDDAFEAGESVIVRVRPDRDTAPLRAVVADARTGATVAEAALGEHHRAELPPLPAGLYRVTVAGDQNVAPVADVFEVFDRPAARARSAVRGTQVRPTHWTNDFVMVDADQVAAVRDAVKRSAAEYLVVRRADDLYALRPSEIPTHWLELPSLAPELEKWQASAAAFHNEAISPSLTSAAEPAAGRVVMRSDRGRPLAVGVVAPRAGASRDPSEDLHGEPQIESGARDREDVAARLPPPPPSAPPPGRRGFRGARGGGGGARPKAAPDTTSITRFPTIELDGKIKPNEAVTIRVDLALQRDGETETAGVSLTLPAGWKEVPVSVHVASPDLVFADGADEGTVLLRNGQPSQPFETRAQVAAELEGRDAIVVRASFTYEGRHSGTARRAFRVAGAAAANGTDGTGSEETAHRDPPPSVPLPDTAFVPSVPKTTAPTDRAAGTVQIDPNAPRPTMTIQMYAIDADAGTFLWHVEVPAAVRAACALPKSLRGVVALGKSAPSYVAQLFENIEQLAAPGHLPFFQGLGDRLYERTPDFFKQAYWAVAAHCGDGFPIQIISDDPYVPWELMRPQRAEGEPAEFLGVTHPIGRWFLAHEGTLLPSIATGAVATIAPDYRSRPELKPLPEAQQESLAILKALPDQARRIIGMKQSVLALLEDAAKSDVALLHFAGHGAAPSPEPDFALVYLQDDDLRALEVRRTETRLGVNRHPIVFLNACQVARSGLNLGVIGGFAEALMNQQFGGFIAPLWAVWDDDAAVVSTRLVSDVVRNHRDFATALQEIRRQHGAASPTFLSYLYYGDVMARFA